MQHPKPSLVPPPPPPWHYCACVGAHMCSSVSQRSTRQAKYMYSTLLVFSLFGRAVYASATCTRDRLYTQPTTVSQPWLLTISSNRPPPPSPPPPSPPPPSACLNSTPIHRSHGLTVSIQHSPRPTSPSLSQSSTGPWLNCRSC